MRKLIVLILVVVALLVTVGPVVADGEYNRIVIPKSEVSAAIQPLKQIPDGSWPEPNHFTAWCLDLESHPEGCLQVIYMHRGNLGSGLPLLEVEDLVYLYKDWGFEHEPLQLRVFELEIIPEDEEPLVWGEVEGSDVFALVTCHPADDPEAPERLVVWAKIDHGPRWVYVDWGDNLSQISRRYGVSVDAVARANGVADPDYIRAGTWLSIP